jgi:hypothetical protein
MPLMKLTVIRYTCEGCNGSLDLDTRLVKPRNWKFLIIRPQGSPVADAVGVFCSRDCAMKIAGEFYDKADS